jgi:hypothetical protein
MTDESQQLTEQEIGTLADGTICGNASETPLLPWKSLKQLTSKESVLAFAHAIKSAVTAKLAKRHAREIVLAKREGWDKRQEYGYGSQRLDTLRAERDRIYPLPTTTKPRTVTLSDGRRVQFSISLDAFLRDAAGKDQFYRQTYVSVRTASDARLIADLIEHPTEEITDD